MKLRAKSYRIGALVAALLLAGCAVIGGSHSTQSSRSDARRVLSAYEVPELLAQAAPAVAQSLDKNLPDGVDSADRQRLRDVVYDVYAPKALADDVTRRLEQEAADAGREDALAEAADTLHDPLATRMIGLQSAAGDDGFARGFNAFMDQPAPAARKRRLRTVSGITRDMSIVDLQTEFNVSLLAAMIAARNAAVPPQQQLADERIGGMMHNTRQGIHAKLAEKVPQMLLYVYRDVDDATLADYAAMQDTPALTWTNQALARAIKSTLEDAGAKIPDRFNQN